MKLIKQEHTKTVLPSLNLSIPLTSNPAKELHRGITIRQADDGKTHLNINLSEFDQDNPVLEKSVTLKNKSTNQSIYLPKNPLCVILNPDEEYELELSFEFSQTSALSTRTITYSFSPS